MARLTPLLVVLLGLAITLPAFAAGGNEGGGETMKFVWELLNFFLLVGAIVYFVRKPAVKFFASRREEIGGELESAARVLEEAEGRFGEWQQKMAEVDGEFEQIRSRERERAQQESNRILADAEQTAERIKADAANAVERELRRAQAQLREEASDLAIELAANILREAVVDSDRDRLMDEFISRIEQTSPSAGSRS